MAGAPKRVAGAEIGSRIERGRETSQACGKSTAAEPPEHPSQFS